MSEVYPLPDTAGISATRQPQASVLPSEDYTLARKLFSSARAAAFVQGTGVSIGVFDKKKKKI